MLVRVYQPAVGPVRVVYPNPRHRRRGESEQAFLARICVITEAADETLKNIPTADMDASALPQDRSQRDAWRLTESVGVTVP